jgi:uncharacterized membrane protein YesL
MKQLFALDGPLMEALGKLADIAICNIAFCLLSLPIFTAGAALTALYSSVQLIVDDMEEGLILGHFFRAFKRNFKQATLLWLLCLLVFAFLGSFYLAVSGLTGILGRVYRVSFFLLAILFLFGFQYLFPLQARYENKVRDTIKNAWLLSVSALPYTLGSIALTVLAVYLSFFMNPDGINMAVFLWAMLGFGLVAYLNTQLFFQRAFRKLEPKQDEPEPVQAEND